MQISSTYSTVSPSSLKTVPLYGGVVRVKVLS
jgi:hypothetical protein